MGTWKQALGPQRNRSYCACGTNLLRISTNFGHRLQPNVFRKTINFLDNTRDRSIGLSYTSSIMRSTIVLKVMFTYGHLESRLLLSGTDKMPLTRGAKYCPSFTMPLPLCFFCLRQTLFKNDFRRKASLNRLSIVLTMTTTH